MNPRWRNVIFQRQQRNSSEEQSCFQNNHHGFPSESQDYQLELFSGMVHWCPADSTGCCMRHRNYYAVAAAHSTTAITRVATEESPKSSTCNHIFMPCQSHEYQTPPRLASCCRLLHMGLSLCYHQAKLRNVPSVSLPLHP
jgi:hypothetical protein